MLKVAFAGQPVHAHDQPAFSMARTAKNAAHEQFAKSGCKEFLETQRDPPAARFANTLLERVSEFSGYNSARAQENDITLLLLDFQ